MKAAKTVLAEYITSKISDVQHFKSQKRIAHEVGFDSPNFVSMLKTGEARLPIDRVVGLAKAIECDPSQLMKLALDAAYGSAVSNDIVSLAGDSFSENERELIRHARVVSGGSVPKLSRVGRNVLGAIFRGNRD